MNGARIARGYDRLAAVYDLLARAVYGNALRKAQACFLADLPADARVLLLGGGSGWFLEALLREAQPREVVYVELSPKMLQHSHDRIRRRLPAQSSKVAFVLGRAEEATMGQEGKFDVVITHCLLDMYAQPALNELISQLKKGLHPQGLWYFSDFFKVAGGGMGPISSALIWAMYRFFRWFCHIEARDLPDFDQGFAVNGLEVERERMFFGTMIRARLYRLG